MAPLTMRADGQTVNSPGHIQVKASPNEVNMMLSVLNRTPMPDELLGFPKEQLAALRTRLEQGNVAFGATPAKGSKAQDSRPDSGKFPDGQPYAIKVDLKPLGPLAHDPVYPVPPPGTSNPHNIQSIDHGERTEAQLVQLMAYVLQTDASSDSGQLKYAATGAEGAFAQEGAMNCVDAHHQILVATGLATPDDPPGAGTRPQDEFDRAKRY